MADLNPQVLETRSPRVERTRTRILDAAASEFAGTGFAKTTVAQIARAAGVSKALLYHHFGGNEEILEGVIERTLGDWDRAVRLEDYLAESDGVLEAIAGSLRAAVEYARERPLVLGLLQMEPQLLWNVGRSAAVKASNDHFRTTLAAALRKGIKSRELRRGLDPELAADSIHMMQMALIEHLLDPEWVTVDAAQVEQMIDILCRGLARLPR